MRLPKLPRRRLYGMVYRVRHRSSGITAAYGRRYRRAWCPERAIARLQHELACEYCGRDLEAVVWIYAG